MPKTIYSYKTIPSEAIQITWYVYNAMLPKDCVIKRWKKNFFIHGNIPLDKFGYMLYNILNILWFHAWSVPENSIRLQQICSICTVQSSFWTYSGRKHCIGVFSGIL